MEIKVENLANAILTLEKNAEITITGGNWNPQNHNEVKRALAARENENMNFVIRFSEELTCWRFKKGTFASPCVKAIYFPVSLIETDFYDWADLCVCEYFDDVKYFTEYHFPEFWKEIPDISKVKTNRIKFYPTDKKQFAPGKYEFWLAGHCNYLEVTATTKKQAIESLKQNPDSFPFNSLNCDNEDVNKAFTFSGFDASESDPIEFSIGKYIENDYSRNHAEDYFSGTIRDSSSKVMGRDKGYEDDGFYLPLGSNIINKKINFEEIELEEPYYIFIDPKKHHVESFVLDAKEGFNLSDIHFNKECKNFSGDFPFSLIKSLYYKNEPLIQNECDDYGNDCLSFYMYGKDGFVPLDPYSDEEVEKLKNIIKSNNEIVKKDFEVKGSVLIKYKGNESEVIIPDGFTEIGEAAFKDCTNITNIVIPDSVTDIGESAFENCSSLKSVKLPNGLTGIDCFSFTWCTGLKSITIPDSVTMISGEAFANCTNLSSVEIPDSVTEICNEAFRNCKISELNHPNLKIKDGFAIDDTTLLYLAYAKSNVVIPQGITFIEEGAFRECTNLISLSIPDSVTEIGEETFADCTSLTDITIQDSVKEIGYGAFEGCTSLSEESKKSIRDHGYEGEF